MSLYNADFKRGDQGGNRYSINDINHHNNLHFLWDDALGLFQQKHKEAFVKSIQKEYPTDSLQLQVYDLSPKHWAKEGFRFAANIYQIPRNTVPSRHYIRK